LVNTSVHDAPLYYDCGLAMNTAWGAMARNPCDMSTWTASDKMKAMVPQCSKLQHGDRYTTSYKALKLDQDTWCGFPKCGNRSDGKKCLQCVRSAEFPFEPHCVDKVPVELRSKSKATTFATLSTVHLVAAFALGAWCM